MKPSVKQILIRRFIIAYKTYVHLLRLYDINEPAYCDFTERGFIIQTYNIKGTVKWSYNAQKFTKTLKAVVRWQHKVSYDEVFEKYIQENIENYYNKLNSI